MPRDYGGQQELFYLEIVPCLVHKLPRCLASCLVWGPPAAAFLLGQWEEGAHTLSAGNNFRSPVLEPSE